MAAKSETLIALFAVCGTIDPGMDAKASRNSRMRAVLMLVS